MKIEAKLLAAEETTVVYGRSGARRILHNLLPEDSYDRLRGMRMWLKSSPIGIRTSRAAAGSLSLVSRSRVLSGLYYTIPSREFDREHQAVLAARARHLQDVSMGRGNIYMLRRNVHRLEKGLLMKPPRPIFGLDKIGETVGAYADCIGLFSQGNESLEGTLLWAESVLAAYFARVADHPVITSAELRFEAALDRRSLPSNSRDKVPYVRTTDCDLPSIDQIENLARVRRSVRWFADRPVPRAAIDRALRVAMEAPSACNRQPFRYEVFDSEELVQLVGSVPKGTPGWLHQIPAFVVIVGKFDAFRFERDRHVPYIDGSLSAMNLINALEVQGIASCCVNFPDFADTEKRMAKVLNLDRWERALMCLAVGYPDENERVAYSEKLPLAMARTFNSEAVMSYLADDELGHY